MQLDLEVFAVLAQIGVERAVVIRVAGVAPPTVPNELGEGRRPAGGQGRHRETDGEHADGSLRVEGLHKADGSSRVSALGEPPVSRGDDEVEGAAGRRVIQECGHPSIDQVA
ncbi:MAG: hypothetical protein AB8I08_34520 [Sandaracinaceae bacterium]